MDHPLGDALVLEVHGLFARMKLFEQGGASSAGR
jgi:hypothetical protein